MKAPVKAKLFNHQFQAYQVGITHDQAAFLMEQGTGKTLSALSVAGHRYLQGQIKKLLIVCPRAVIPAWANEFQKFANFEYTLHEYNNKHKARILEAVKSTKADPLMVLVMNYESTWRVEKELNKCRFDMIILDESQNIKNGQPRKGSKHAKALHRLGDRTRYKLILTGTPISEGPLDIWSQYRFLKPSIFGDNWFEFRNRHATFGGYMGYEITRYKRLDELTDKTYSIAYRGTKDDALVLPPVVHQEIFIELGKESRKIYNDMAEEAVVEFNESQESTANLVLTRLLRCQQITGGFLPTDEDEEGKREIIQVGSEKLNTLKDLIGSFPKTKKVVIFARFIPEIRAIEKLLKKMGRKWVTLTGGTKNIKEIINDFQTDPQIGFFIAQIRTGGVGITLTEADTAIFYSKSFSYIQYDQALARVHRIGSEKHKKITYIHLLAEDTVDLQLQLALRTKRDLASLVIDKMRKGEMRDMANLSVKEYQKKLEGLRQEVEATVDEIAQKKAEEAPVIKIGKVESEPKKKRKKKVNKDEPKVFDLTQAEDPVAEYFKLEEEAKQPKKKKEKKEKAPKEAVGADSIITLQQLAQEVGVEPPKLRKQLRKNKDIEKPSGRWEWPIDHPDLEKIRGLFK